MPPKPAHMKQNETRRSLLVIPSRVVSRPDELQGGEETEIAAQISVPHEGIWSWVVVMASFCSIFILDGVAFTFGSAFKDITEDMQMDESLITFINSIAVSLYLIAGPVTSALINRFGFRACAMSGSVIVSLSFLCTYFSTNYFALCLFYGVTTGLGYCLINMSSSLVVGFYFEKLRSLALSIATTGSSFGVMVMFPLNSYVVERAGWRVMVMLHCGMFGFIYFLAMTYRPLLSLTVMKTTDDPTRTVTYLPSLASAAAKQSQSGIKGETLVPTATEKLFSAVSNINFPTAAAVVVEDVKLAANQPGPSNAVASRLTLTAHAPQGGISHRQLKQVKSIISKTSVQDKMKRNVEVTVNIEPPKKKSCWEKLCHWEEHIPQSRPMYRDDAFYDGKLETLPIYQKSMMDTSTDVKTGLEYQLAVSRAVTTVDLHEQRGICTTAARRILATMMDPLLLKRCSFLMFCTSGFLTYLGYLVPYVFLPDRNKEAGVSDVYCTWFVSSIGLSNGIGRLALGALACKIDPLKLYTWSTVIAGVSTMLSSLSYNVYYQYLYCSIFGFNTASIACLRSMALVNLYGLEKLTNATGMMLLFQGIGSLVCTPAASAIKSIFGYSITFFIAGFFITLSGLCLLPIKSLCKSEDLKAQQKQDLIVKKNETISFSNK